MTSSPFPRSLPLGVAAGLSSLFGIGSLWVPSLFAGIFPLAALAMVEGIRISVERPELGQGLRAKLGRTAGPLVAFVAALGVVLLAANELGVLRGPFLGLPPLLWFVPSRAALSPRW